MASLKILTARHTAFCMMMKGDLPVTAFYLIQVKDKPLNTAYIMPHNLKAISYPTCTVSIDMEPPSTSSMGNLIFSFLCVAPSI